MNEREQAKAVLAQMLDWVENTGAAVNSGDWDEVKDQTKRLRTLTGMLLRVSEHAAIGRPGFPTSAASAASRILKRVIRGS